MSDAEGREHLVTSIERLEELLGKLPGAVGRELRERVAELRHLLAEQRPPRLVLVGRRGSGKSSLVNALFGAKVAELGHEGARTARGEWHRYTGGAGRLDILDTRGFQEGAPPAGADVALTPLESILRELRAKAPDAVLFLLKARDIDAAIQEDVRQLEELYRELSRLHRASPPLLAVVTHCDELEPKAVRLHAHEGEDRNELDEKLARVRRVERALEDRLRATPLRDQLVGVLGVSAYQSWRGDGTQRADERWRIDELVAALFRELPDQARVELARLAQVTRLQLDVAHRLTTLVAGISASIAATPIPIADIVPLTSLQLSLVTAIGHVSGRVLSAKSAAEFLAAMGVNVGAGLALREAARALVKFVFPGGGLYVSAAVAYAGTLGLGRAAAAYFIQRVAASAARSAYDEGYREGSGSTPGR